MRYLTCPCGRSDGNDDAVLLQELVFVEYNASQLIVKETRKCDSCSNEYVVLLHYKFAYETRENL